MDTFSKSELKLLLEQQARRCVRISIFMPTFKSGADVQQNPIRLRNLLREAEERLVATGLRRPEAIRLLRPARELLDDSFFWRNQSDGLALFVSEDFFRYFRLPFPFKELAVVGDRFHVKPLLHHLLSGDGKFYVLALSQQQVRLLECTHYGVKDVVLAGMFPKNFAEFMRYEELDKEQMYHLHAGTAGAEPMIAHGQEVGEEVKEDILRYFQQIDKGLRRDVLREESAPLVLASVEYLSAIYRQANTHPNTLEDSVPGNPDELSSEQLHNRAWEVAQPYFEQTRIQAMNQYQELRHTTRTSNDLKKIVPAAYHGQVYVLFVADGVEQWGNFDPDTGSINLHKTAEPCDHDLLDFASAHALAHRATLYVTKPEEVPGGSPISAVFRYRPPQEV